MCVARTCVHVPILCAVPAQVECQEWVRTVDLLLKDALEDGPLGSRRMASSQEEGVGVAEGGVAKSSSNSMQARSGGSPTAPLEGGGASEEEVFVLGVDSNVYRKSLMDLGKMANVRAEWGGCVRSS